MTTIYKRKLYRDKPIKLNWFDLTLIWVSGKADIAGDWMNNNPFICSFVFFFSVFVGLFLALGDV